MLSKKGYKMRVITKGRFPIKGWFDNIQIEESALQQLVDTSNLPFIYKWVAAMPDCHTGQGATIGSVIPTIGAICPSSVGVDIGCGMIAAHFPSSILGKDKVEANTQSIYDEICKAVPHGRTDNGGSNDIGSWRGNPPNLVIKYWTSLDSTYRELIGRHPKANSLGAGTHQLGTLGGGNHFIEVSYDENGEIWVVIHSGSRGPGNKFGAYFSKLAKQECDRWFISLPNNDLAYLVGGTDYFNDYLAAQAWSLKYALYNRRIMMYLTIEAISKATGVNLSRWDHNSAEREGNLINCHHNYVSKENHYDRNVWITRKGAISARRGEFGIIPGSMGSVSYIVSGLGNDESFTSASHGAGRIMSRTEARKTITIEDHIKNTEGIICNKTTSVLDESPSAYKNIDSVMNAQKDLVEIVHTLHQRVCVKGEE
jgi:tRNA-splicing ligase RtcB (3'-phosphate/5'-hydroxy nucleic acid ligase)